MKISEKAQAAFDKVIEQFKSGDLSPVVRIARLPKGEQVPWDKWSYTNRISTYLMTGSTDLRGYKQWRKVGRQVQKGASAAYILVPLLTKYTVEDGDGNEVEKFKMRGFRTVAVFAVEDTEGDPLPDRNQTPSEPPPLTDLAESLGIEIEYSGRGQALGSCTVDGKLIRLATHEQEVFWHELGHAMHARIEGGNLRGGNRNEQETVAEFTAAVLAAMYGQDISGNAWQYIRGYNPDDPMAAITGAMGTVERIVEHIESVKGAQ